MDQTAKRKFSPWLLALFCGLFVEISACPKPQRDPNLVKNGNTSTTEPSEPSSEEEKLCMEQDWTRPREINAKISLQCNEIGFREKISPCYDYDWQNPDSIPQEQREICLAAGWQNRFDACENHDWSLAFQIEAEEKKFCESLGFVEAIDPELCENQDWTKPKEIPEEIKDMCLKISAVPTCDPNKKGSLQDAFCTPPNTPKPKDLFTHTGHGIDLPNQPASRTLSIKGRNIECADCHSGDCNPRKGSVDINRPDHNSCAGIKTCHPDFASDRTICKSCHLGNKVSFRPPLRPYGAGSVVPILEFGFDFNHDSHVNPLTIGADCKTCHEAETKKELEARIKKDIGSNSNSAVRKEIREREKQGKPEIAGAKMTGAAHKECGQCHCKDDAQTKMNDCKTCHTGEDSAKSGHAFLQWRPHAQAFNHKTHETGPDGKPVNCVTCHISVEQSTSLLEIAVPPMLGCLQSCHDGSHKNTKTKQPIFDGWVKCAECHAPGKLPESTTKTKRN